MNIEFHDNSKEVLASMQESALRVLEKCGQVAEGYAKRLAPSPGKTGTGQLRNDISHKLDPNEPAVQIGCNVEWGIYQELGTGKYYPGGRPTPWVYQDDNGNWHWTAGNPAQPFIKPAVADHAREYIQIIESELKNG